MNKPSRRSRGTVTIEDVARLAGVSAMTVSRVINRGKNVRETTRRKVVEAVEQLNYSPNAAARSLAAGEATHIGLLYANPSASYLSKFLVGALDGARKAGCHLIIEACESDDAAERAEATRRFAGTNIEGIILPPPLSDSPEILAELDLAEIPVVTVAMGFERDESLNIRINDFAAAADMTNHLLDLGHRRIGFIKGHPNHLASDERERGFLAAIEQRGIDARSCPIEQGYFTFRSGFSAAEQLLRRPDRPTAVFASNDDMAAATVTVAHRLGLSVPADISVVGFDNTLVATTIWPELTTVNQPISAMAEAALELLLADLRARSAGGKRRPAERVLGHELVIRESSGPPPAYWIAD